MRRRERRAIEKRLPRRFRGARGYGRLLESMTIRVSVSGIRGKSGLTGMVADALQDRGLSVYAKQTGTRPVSIKDGKVHPIERDPRKKAVLAETQWEVKKHWPMDAVVLENQGISEYTMRTFNRLYCRPHYLLVTNVRRDHQGDLGRRLQDMARAFGRSASPGCTVVCGERDPALKAIVHKEAQRVGARFIDAAPQRTLVPGYESVTVLDAMLRDWTGNGLSPGELRAQRARLERTFRWREAGLPGVKWFHGAEINDVDSTEAILRYLLHREPMPVTFIAYFREDRPDRTASFVPFLRSMVEQGVAARVVLCGHRARTAARRMGRRNSGSVWVVEEDLEQVPEFLWRLGRVCRGQAVMTVANAVPPWPSRVAELLERGVGPVEPGKAQEQRLRAALRGGAAAPQPALVRFEEVRSAPGPSPSNAVAG